MSGQRQVYTALPAGAKLIRDISFPHQVVRALSLEYGLKIAEFKPRVGKHSPSRRLGLKPQQAELLELAEQFEARILTRTKALAISPLALVFSQELPNEDLLKRVLAALKAGHLIYEGE